MYHSYVSRCNSNIKEGAHIGHGAIIHGAVIGKNCLVGMNAVIMDNVELEDECIVGALSFINEGEKFKHRSLIVGNPAKKIKEVSDKMMAWKTEGTKIYQQLPVACKKTLKACKPLQKVSKKRHAQKADYKPWKSKRKKF